MSTSSGKCPPFFNMRCHAYSCPGVSQNHISSIENDKEKPSVTLQKLVCYKFNIDEEWLREGQGSLFPECNVPIIDGEIDEDELLLAKYGELRLIVDSFLKKRTGNELKYTVLALNYLVGILACPHLKEENKEDFLEAVCNILDEMEQLKFQSSIILNYGKKEYRHFLKYRNMTEKRIFNIEQQVRAMNTVYLKQYKIDGEIIL